MTKGNVYASSDWHGCYDVGMKVLNFLKPEDTLYFIGDVIDRGPRSIDLLKEMVKRPNVIMLAGNHEEMMINAMPSYKAFRDDFNQKNWTVTDESYEWLDNWNWNGGQATQRQLDEMSPQEINELFYILNSKMYNKSLTYITKQEDTIILEHAGFTPGLPNIKHDPLWDRSHFYDNWSKEDFAQKIYIVHGHTPVPYLQYSYGYKGDDLVKKDATYFKERRDWINNSVCNNPQVLRYCEGHKFDVDMCTIVTNTIALLNLDTFETIYFKGDNKNEENLRN